MPSSDPLDNNGGTDANIEEIEDQVGDAYNNVNLSGAGTDLEFFTPNGGTTAVKSITLPTGSGTGQNFEAFNSVSELNGVYTFETNYGNSIGTTIDIGGITTNSASITGLSTTVTDIKDLTGTSTLKTTVDANTNDITDIKDLIGTSTLNTTVSDLSTTVTGHTNDINDFESREQFKSVTQLPDLTAGQIDALTNPNLPLTVNGRTWHFEHSSSQPSVAQSVHSAFSSNPTRRWESLSTNPNNVYNSLVSGSYYDYSGTKSIGGTLGEWITIQLPEAVILSSFTISADSSLSIPRSFKVFGSVDGSSFDLLGEYTDVDVATTDAGTHFKLDSSLAAYGSAYDYYAFVVTRVERVGSNQNVAIRHLRYFSVSKDVSNVIATAATSFYNANITGTNILNLISDSGTTSLTLPGGTTAATSVDAITFNFTVQTGADGSDKYFLHDTEPGLLPINLILNHKYIFTFPAGHPLKLSTEEDGGARDTTTGVSLGNEEYTFGVTYDSSTQLTFVNKQVRLISGLVSVNPVLYFYCENHANMGGNLIEDTSLNTITGISYDSSVPKLEISRAYHDMFGSTTGKDINLSDSFVSAQKDGDNIKLTTISGAQTTVGPFSGGGTAASSTTNYPTSAMTSNALPSPLVAVGSSEYSLFTDKLFGDDNLGNIGTVGSNNFTIQQWAYDATDGNIVLMAHDNASGTYTIFIKISLTGVAVTGLGGNTANTGKYINGVNNTYTSAADLIDSYNNDAAHSTHTTAYLFTKHSLFDLAVNNSPAFHAFDDDATTEWVSQSNTYKPTTTVIDFSAYIDKTVEYAQAELNQHYGFLQPQFMCENPRVQATSSNSNFEDQKGSYTPNTGGINFWHAGTTNLSLFRVVADANGTMEVKYGNLWTGNNVVLEHTSGGSTTTYTNGAVETTQTLTVLKDDIIEIVETLGVIALYSISFTRSTEVGDYIGVSEPQTKLSSNAGAGGYSCSASSVNAGSTTSQPFEPFMAFEGNSSPAANTWVSAPGSYLGSGAYNGSNSIVTTTGTASGEYIILNMPHALKLSAVKLAGQYTTGTPPRTSAPKGWSVYGKNSGNWELIQHFTNSIPGNGFSTYNLTTPSTIAYQSFAIVVTESNGDSQVCISEIEFVGLPALGATTDVGEFIKIDLGSAITAETLNLKSITEYKEPRINMSDYNQCGYEATASSENNASINMVWQLFDNLRFGSPNVYDDIWASSGTSYDSGNSWNANTVRQLAANTEYGEWVKLKLPDKRKLVAYKLSRQDYSDYKPAPRKFRLYGSNDDSTWTEIAGSAVTRAATDPINSYSSSPNIDAASGSRFDLSTVSPAYQYFALVIEQTHQYQLCSLQEFELFCQPSEIEEFKLYASPDDSSWTEIHAQTSANITSSGTDFTIDSPGSYQHYGLVIKKNYGYHNVSLGEMKLAVSGAVNLSNYYTKPETISLLPKGVWAEASVVYIGNSSSSYLTSQLAVSAVGGHHLDNSDVNNPGVSMGTLATSHWNGPLWWSSAPEAHRWAFTHYFNTPYKDDIGEESSEYKVVLTKTTIYMFEIFVIQKQPTWCTIGFYTAVNPMNYHIPGFSYDLMVF